MTTPINEAELRKFLMSDQLFEVYKEYIIADDLTMVEFGKLIYPLITKATEEAKLKQDRS